jgi:hypothetical protein
LGLHLIAIRDADYWDARGEAIELCFGDGLALKDELGKGIFGIPINTQPLLQVRVGRLPALEAAANAGQAVAKDVPVSVFYGQEAEPDFHLGVGQYSLIFVYPYIRIAL